MKDILDDHLFGKKDNYLRKRRKWFRISLILQLTASIIAIPIGWYDIESIIGSGPILSTLGGITGILAYLTKNKKGVYMGISPILFSCICIFIILYYKLSPPDAQIPIGIYITITGLISLLFGWIALKDSN